MFDAGKLRSVESLSTAGQSSRAAEVGRGWSIDIPGYDGMLWLIKGVSIWLLARTGVRCCSGRTVLNSESLRGLRGTLQERRGQ